MTLSRPAIQSFIKAYQGRYNIHLNPDKAQTLGLQLLNFYFQLMRTVDLNKLAIINQSYY